MSDFRRKTSTKICVEVRPSQGLGDCCSLLHPLVIPKNLSGKRKEGTLDVVMSMIKKSTNLTSSYLAVAQRAD